MCVNVKKKELYKRKSEHWNSFIQITNFNVVRYKKITGLHQFISFNKINHYFETIHPADILFSILPPFIKLSDQLAASLHSCIQTNFSKHIIFFFIQLIKKSNILYYH